MSDADCLSTKPLDVETFLRWLIGETPGAELLGVETRDGRPGIFPVYAVRSEAAHRVMRARCVAAGIATRDE